MEEVFMIDTKKLIEKKKSLHLTFDELSNRSNIPKRTLEDIFSGRTQNPRIDTLKAIERALAVKEDENDLYLSTNDKKSSAFPEISKSLRKENGLSQVQLAEALNVSKACISMIEIGKNDPTANTLLKYADFFQCSTDYLLGREDDLGNITIHTEKPAPLPQDEQTLLNNFRKLPEDLRHRAAVYMQNLADAAEEESFNFHGGKNYGNKTKTL